MIPDNIMSFKLVSLYCGWELSKFPGLSYSIVKISRLETHIGGNYWNLLNEPDFMAESKLAK